MRLALDPGFLGSDTTEALTATVSARLIFDLRKAGMQVFAGRGGCRGLFAVVKRKNR